jgi:hypothetical protein
MCGGGKFRYPLIPNPPFNVGHGHIIGTPNNDVPNSVQCSQSVSTRAVNVQTESYDGQGVSTAQSGFNTGDTGNESAMDWDMQCRLP